MPLYSTSLNYKAPGAAEPQLKPWKPGRPAAVRNRLASPSTFPSQWPNYRANRNAVSAVTRFLRLTNSTHRSDTLKVFVEMEIKVASEHDRLCNHSTHEIVGIILI